MTKRKNVGKTARNDAARPRARDPETGKLLLRPGQPHIGSKLDYDLEKRICECIAQGLTIIDSCGLCDIDAATLYRWKERGESEPESRYGEFQRACEKAELECKKVWIAKVAASDDWRAHAFLLKAKYPKEYTEHVRQELSGPDGLPIAVNNQNPFQVIVELGGDPNPTFTVVDHRTEPHQESATLPDPFSTHSQTEATLACAREPGGGYPLPGNDPHPVIEQSNRAQRSAKQRWTGSHALERFGKVKNG